MQLISMHEYCMQISCELSIIDQIRQEPFLLATRVMHMMKNQPHIMQPLDSTAVICFNPYAYTHTCSHEQGWNSSMHSML